MHSDTFPVQDSTLSANALAESVTVHYGIQSPITCHLYRKGICDTYKLETPSVSYYLKVYKHGRRSRLDVTEEARLLHFLAQHDVSVALPLSKLDGQHELALHAPEGERYALLFEAAKGTSDDNGDPQRIRALGDMVGHMHVVADMFPGEYQRQHLDLNHLVDENLDVIVPFMAHRQADLRVIQELAASCKQQITQLLPQSKPEYGICHGDLHGGDVCYDGNNVPTLFDFDSSGCGWRALDIGVYLASDKWMDISSDAEEKRQRKLDVFLEGYEHHRTLSDNDLAAMQLTPLVRHIFLMGHVLRYTAIVEGNHWANDGFIDWHMTWFKYWLNKRRIFR